MLAFAGCGTGAANEDAGGSKTRDGRLSLHDYTAKTWLAWDRRHGFAWRIQHDAAHSGDRRRAYWCLTGRRERKLGRIAERMPDLLERARSDLELEPAPDPPGFELA